MQPAHPIKHLIKSREGLDDYMALWFHEDGSSFLGTMTSVV